MEGKGRKKGSEEVEGKGRGYGEEWRGKGEWGSAGGIRRGGEGERGVGEVEGERK